jgi:hypothetical protein
MADTAKPPTIVAPSAVDAQSMTDAIILALFLLGRTSVENSKALRAFGVQSFTANRLEEAQNEYSRY